MFERGVKTREFKNYVITREEIHDTVQGRTT
jgi:hypothetical protein